MACNISGKLLQEFEDVKFPQPNSSVDGYVMRYNHSKNGFDLVSAGGVLEESTETDVPQEFIEVVEGELDLERIAKVGNFDGGSFVDY